MSIFWFVILLFLAGMTLVFAEILAPGGILGILAGVCFIGSCYLGYRFYPGYWGTIVIAELGLGTVLFLVGLKYLPKTRMGQAFILNTRQSQSAGYVSEAENLRELLGKNGSAQTDLRPSGIARIDGKRMNVVTEGAYVEANTELEVVEVEGNRVVVRPLAKSASD